MTFPRRPRSPRRPGSPLLFAPPRGQFVTFHLLHGRVVADRCVMKTLSVALLVCCLTRAASAQSASGLESLMDSVVPAAMAAERIPGAVVTVVSGGRVIFSKG